MPFSITTTQAQLIAAKAMQDHCELRQVALLRCSVDGAGPATVPSQPTPLAISLQAAYANYGALNVEVSFHVDGEPHLVFHIDVTVLLKYEINSGFEPTEKHLRAFADLVAISDAWPYAREFIQDITARMGLSTSPLPALRVVSQSVARPRTANGQKSA